MAIYGECIAAGLAAAVRVSKLVDTGCELLIEKGSVLLDGEFSLWIGAIGPLAITTSRCDEVTLSASFTQPLDPRIIAHFGDA